MRSIALAGVVLLALGTATPVAADAAPSPISFTPIANGSGPLLPRPLCCHADQIRNRVYLATTRRQAQPWAHALPAVSASIANVDFTRSDVIAVFYELAGDLESVQMSRVAATAHNLFLSLSLLVPPPPPPCYTPEGNPCPPPPAAYLAVPFVPRTVYALVAVAKNAVGSPPFQLYVADATTTVSL